MTPPEVLPKIQELWGRFRSRMEARRYFQHFEQTSLEVISIEKDYLGHYRLYPGNPGPNIEGWIVHSVNRIGDEWTTIFDPDGWELVHHGPKIEHHLQPSEKTFEPKVVKAGLRNRYSSLGGGRQDKSTSDIGDVVPVELETNDEGEVVVTDLREQGGRSG